MPILIQRCSALKDVEVVEMVQFERKEFRRRFTSDNSKPDENDQSQTSRFKRRFY